VVEARHESFSIERNTRMKWALIGLGYWGSKVLRNMVTILGPQGVVAVDASGALVEWAASSYPGLTCRATLEDALTDPEVVGVVIATPVASHSALTEIALRAGRSVLVEKPLAGSAAEARRLADLADDTGQLLMVGHTFLFSPRLDVIRAYIEAGTLGPIHYVTMSRFALGPYRSDVNVIWDLAPHDVSILCYLLGEFPATVRTSGRSITRPGSPDVAFMTMEFPSGVVAEISVSWLAPRKVRNTIIVGDTRMLVYDDMDADEPIKLHDKRFVLPEGDSFGAHQLTYRTGDTVAPYVSADEPLANQLHHFMQCIRGATCRSDGWFGVSVVEVLESADRSYRDGGIPVEVEHRAAVAGAA
jgi:predicted dehydrogenase